MTISNVDIVWDYDPNIVETLVEYKKDTEDTYIKPTAYPNPTTANKYILALEEGKYYNIRLTSKMVGNCTPSPIEYRFLFNPSGHTTTTTTTSTTSTTTSTTSTTTSTTTTIYIPPVQKEFINLASPYTLMYNSVNDNFYFTDYDAPHSLRKFDPATAQDEGDFVDVASGDIGAFRLGAAVYDSAHDTLYAHGDISSGLIIVDCSTDTVLKVISYGSNSLSNRQDMYLISGIVYAYTLSGNKFVTVSTSTNNKGNDFIPDSNGSYPTGSLIDDGGSKIWILQSGGGAARAISYNKSDLTTVVDTVNTIAQVMGANGHIEVSSGWYDSSSKEIWFSSPGDNYIGVIDTQTGTLSHTINIPMEGKGFSYLKEIHYSPNDGLYFTGRLTDSTTDAGIFRTYLMDRNNYKIAGKTNTQLSGKFIHATSTDKDYVASTGLVWWNTPNTGYDTDGKIVVYGGGE